MSGLNQLTNLKFSISGKEATIEKVNINQPLGVSAAKALKDTGSSRPLKDYDIFFNNVKIDGDQKVESFSFPEGAVLFLSLKTGKGGFR